MTDVLAKTPSPPYWAVIFSSVRTSEDDIYGTISGRMVELAQKQDGFLGIESVREDRTGITVSYWKDEESIRAWRGHVEHLVAQRLGRERWYEAFEIRIARVERVSSFERETR